MTLEKAVVGTIYRVEVISLQEPILGRLQALGMTKGTQIKILNRNKNGSVILMVRGSRLALGRQITKGVGISILKGERISR